MTVNSRHILLLLVMLHGCMAAPAADVTLRLPDIAGRNGQIVDVPLIVAGAEGMSAMQALMIYDPEILEIVAGESITNGPILPESAILHAGTATPGRLPVLFLGGADPTHRTVAAIKSDGTLATLRFRVIGMAGQRTELTLEKVQAFQLNDMDMRVVTEPGLVVIVRTPPFPWVLLGAVFLVLLFLLVLLRRSRHRREAAARRQPELVAVPVDSVLHTCVSCGRAVRVPGSLVGTMFKCPACDTAQTIQR